MIRRLTEVYPITETQSGPSGLTLLITFRSIYLESIHFLYASNDFFIADLSILIDWANIPLLRPQGSQLWPYCPCA